VKPIGRSGLESLGGGSGGGFLLSRDRISKEADSMKLAIVSDTHFGDQMCALIDHNKPFDDNGSPRLGPRYNAFKDRAGEDNHYLILLGDIFDFSLAGYAKAYQVAKAFFVQIKNDNIAKSVIYVPGNHDFDMWHTVEHQIRIIRQVRKGRPAKRFRWSAPGFIDDRTSRDRGFRLPGIIDRVIDPEGMPEDEDSEKMYLNNIAKNEDGSGEETNFYFAYPKLYMVTDTESILMTHGHYLEAYWSMLGEWAVKIGKEAKGIGDDLDTAKLVAINYPQCQLACSGIGQAGPLTEEVQKLQREVKDRQLKKLPGYLKNLDDEIDELTPYEFFDPRELATDLFSRYVRGKILDKLKKFIHTRDSEEFIDSRDRPSKEVLRRFRNFYEASCLEIDELNDDDEVKLEIPKPKTVIFGHTHRPILWRAEDAPHPKVGVCDSVTLCNAGGWLWRESTCGRRTFCGAAVFTYREGEFDSHLVQ
jgi:UDP-2,3-diacylglucosamine pyrophosphatase LpxH